MTWINRLAGATLGLVAAAAFVACATHAGQPGASAPAASIADLPRPTPDGEVRAAAMVLEDGDGPQLCSSVLESYPPQCGGLAIEGWDWDAIEHDDVDGVRWTEYGIAHGTFDGETFTVTQPLSALEETDDDVQTGTADQATIDLVLADIESLDRDDVSSWGAGDGIVQLSVSYDDGSMQSFLDALYGDDVVQVTSWMHDV